MTYPLGRLIILLKSKHLFTVRTLWLLAFGLLLPMSLAFGQSSIDLTGGGAAHFFDPASNDQSLIYLGEIFGNVPPVLAGTGSTLMSELFSVLNSAVVVLGVFFLGYTVFVGILNTAGEGEMLGRKWSSIWVPVRMVAGLGLIIPTASGYCVCQIFVMWLVVQGIGAADHLTSTIVDYMKAGKPVYVKGISAATEDSAGQSVLSTYDSELEDLYVSLTCMQANQEKDSTDSIQPPEPTCGSDISGVDACTNTSNDIVYNFKAPNGEDCGSVSFTPNNTAEYQAASSYIIDAVSMVMPSLNAAAYYLVNYNPYLHDDNPDNDDEDYSPQNDDEAAILQATYDFVGSNFLNELQQTYNSYQVEASDAMENVDYDSNNDDYYDAINAYGWVSLGDIYWYMINSAEIEEDGGKAGNTYLAFSGDASHGKYDFDENNISQDTAKTYIGWAKSFFVSLQDNETENTASTNSFNISKFDEHLDENNFQKDVVNALANMIGNETMDAIEDEFTSEQNPLVAAQQVGHKMVKSAQHSLNTIISVMISYSILAGISASVSPAFLAGQGIFSILAPMIFLWIGFTYTTGGMLSVIVPMLPAVIFFLAICNWMVTVVESMVASPIVAIGMLHAEGHEVWGKAEPAVMLLVNMFLRPSLIVIGMAAGVLLSFVFLQFVNFAFWNAMELSLNGDQPEPVELLLYVTTYLGVVLAIVNQAFTSVNVIPEQVLRWIAGGEGAKFAGSGGADQMGKVEQQQGKGQEHAASSVKAQEGAVRESSGNFHKASESRQKQIENNNVKNSSSGESGNVT